MTCTDSVFQMRDPATGKVREPVEVSRTAGTIYCHMTACDLEQSSMHS